ncbi:MAG: hypothetical protein K9I69_03090 [Ignavibacteriales bacterium]|nr:hypothetical protein [Ignavibacteriales bacterium]
MFIFIFAAGLKGQNLRLGTAGDISLTGNEFLKRFELSARAGNYIDRNEEKEKFLITLAAEKLWYLEALDRGLSDLMPLKKYILEVEKLYLRDKLFEIEIISKVNVTDENIKNEFINFNTKAKVRYFYTLWKNEADSVTSLLHKFREEGKTQLIKDFFQNKPEAQLSYGVTDYEIESELFNLSDSMFSKVFPVNKGYIIYFMEKKSVGEKFFPASDSPEYRKVEKRFKDYRTEKEYNSWTENFLKSSVIYADNMAFSSSAEILHRAVQNKLPEGNQKDSLITLDYDDFIRLINDTADDTLSKVLIKFNSDPVTIVDFMYYLAFYEVSFANGNLVTVRKMLNHKIREFIRLELITREAIKRGFRNNAELREDLQMWEQNFLSHYARNRMMDSLSANKPGIENFLSDNSRQPITMFRFIEYVNLNLDEAYSILTNNSNSILKSNPKFDSTKFYYPAETGELSGFLENMHPGELFGPINKSGGYTILKLLEKQEILQSDIENSVETDQEALISSYIQQRLDSATNILAEKFGLDLDFNSLEKIKVSEINTLVYRKFGFGGKILAVPFENMNYKWFDTEKKKTGI